jgi:PAS domain S-box-containing protein
MQKPFRRRLNRAFALPVLVLAIVAFALFAAVARLDSDMQWVDHTDRVVSLARHVQRLMLDTESGMRGYLLTGDSSFLAPYQDADANLGPAFNDLEAAVGDNAGQRQRVERLRVLYAAYHNATDQLIAKRRATGQYDVASLLETQRQMTDMRILREEFVAQEETLRDARVRRAEWAGKIAYGLSIGLMLLLGVVLIVFTRREVMDLAATYDRALLEAESRAQELHGNQEWLHSTLDSLAEGVLATDEEGNLEFMNAAAENITGWRKAAAVGRPLATVLALKDERTGAPMPDLAMQVRGSAAALTTIPGAVLVRRDQTALVVDYSAAVLRSDSAERGGIVVALRDISERRRAEEALRASEKLADTGRLAATIAHEIRNPLEAVVNVLYLLRTGGHLTRADLALVATANDEASRIAQITQQLLSSYRETRERVPVTLSELLEGVLLLFSAKFTKAGVKLETGFRAAAPVLAFAGEIRQVFTNLVGNAIEATPRGGKVTVRVAPSHEWRSGATGVRVVIADTGHGIPLEHRGRLFQPFFTTKGEQGTGLGLWVSEGIIRKHGGAIRVRSRVGAQRSGTVFSIFLPIAAEAAAPLEAA